MKALGLDIGERRIGVARASAGLNVAVPLAVVEFDSPDQAVERIVALVHEERPDLVVYGIPLNHQGEAAEQAGRVMSLVKRLSEALPDVRMEPVDESFTTRAAAEALRSMKVKPRDRKKVIDKIAAAVLLQRYLDRARET